MKERYTEDRECTASLTLLGCIVGMLAIIAIRLMGG